jgi:hypothetical protein
MFSVPNAGNFERQSDLNVVYFESELDRGGENWIELFLKIPKLQAFPYVFA